MNTFINRSARAIIAWLLTNIIAAFVYFLAILVGFEFEPFICLKCTTTLTYVIFFGAVFSLPVVMLLIPNLYVLARIPTQKKRIVFTLTSILIICVIVIIVFIGFIGTSEYGASIIVLFLLPYIFAAEFSFCLMARSLIWQDHASLKMIIDQKHI